jgi:hypothetical protein
MGEIIGPLLAISTIMTGHVLCIAMLKTADWFVELKESVIPMKGLDDSRVEEVKP